jgi:hypothetical protein
MSEEHQVHLPESFVAIYVPIGKLKPTLSREQLLQRYELCEDMAHLLTERAADLQFQLGITEAMALDQCENGLLAEPAVVSPAEARWVVCRLAELLQWPMTQLLERPLPLGDSA